jgi:hypothetical protein
MNQIPAMNNETEGPKPDPPPKTTTTQLIEEMGERRREGRSVNHKPNPNNQS